MRDLSIDVRIKPSLDSGTRGAFLRVHSLTMGLITNSRVGDSDVLCAVTHSYSVISVECHKVGDSDVLAKQPEAIRVEGEGRLQGSSQQHSMLISI